MIFEPCRLICEICIAHSVRLVEAVAGKFHEPVIYLLSDLRLYSVLNASGNICGKLVFGSARCLLFRDLPFISVNEDIPFVLHKGCLLFTHGRTNDVTPADAVACKLNNDLHYLFLVNYAAVRGSEDRFKFGTKV